MSDDNHSCAAMNGRASDPLDTARPLPAILDRIRAADNLPSLPSIALQVLELSRRDNVSLGQIADIIQQDPALTGRLLKLVNSSFFGMSRKVSTLQQAMSLLGLRTVKIMILSFSLVDMLGQVPGANDAAFDYTCYWRRSLTTAVAGRLLAERTRLVQPDEAFVAGLLCDIGVLAAVHAAPDLYQPVLEQAARSSCVVQEIETALLGITHETMGQELLVHWGLPEALCEAIGCHHATVGQPWGNREVEGGSRWRDAGATLSSRHDAPAAAGTSCLPLIRVIQAAALVGELFCGEPGQVSLTPAAMQITEHLPVPEDMLTGILEELDQHVRETASLFNVAIGPTRGYQDIQAQAVVQLARLSMDGELERTRLVQQEQAVRQRVQELSDTNQRLADQVATDSLTGVCSRAEFEHQLAAACSEAARQHRPLALLFIDLDRFKQVNDTFGHHAGDAALRQVGQCLLHLGKAGVAGRYGGEEFAVAAWPRDLDELRRLAEDLRRRIHDLQITCNNQPVPVTASIGGILVDSKGGRLHPEQLIQRADSCLYKAKRAGRNCVVVQRENTAGE